MTKRRLEALKHITTWGGVLITLGGIVLNWNSGTNLLGRFLSLGGVIITCCGHVAAHAINRHQKAEKDAAAKQFAELAERVQGSEEFVREFGDLMDDAPYLRKAIKVHKDEDFIRGFNGDDWK